MSETNDQSRLTESADDDQDPDVGEPLDPDITQAEGDKTVANASEPDSDMTVAPDAEGPQSAPGSGRDAFATIAPTNEMTAARSVGQTRPDIGITAADADQASDSVDGTRADAGQFDEPEEFLTVTSGGDTAAAFFGRYEIKRLLGEGAFGKVFEALDPQLDRIVALKVAKTVAGETQIKRFTREAKSAAQLRHPHIIPVYEYGQFEAQSYIVYEYVAGETLKFMNKRVGRIPFDQAVAIVREIAEGLDYAHEQGIIHRDIKPDNVMIDPKGGIHIADFGCARAENDRTDLTVDGSILGTPMYMSPEQASGNSRTADGRTDIWSLGVMFYELLSGERPFDGSLTELLHWICNNDPKQLRKINPEIPIDLETICSKCLNRDLDKRFLKAGDLADELTRFQVGEPIESRRIGPIERSWKWAKRNRTVASLITAVVTVLLLGTFFSLTYAFKLKSAQTEHVATQIRLLQESEARALPDIIKSLTKLQQVGGIKQKLNKELTTLADDSQLTGKGQAAQDNKRFRVNMALLEIAKAEKRTDLDSAVDQLLEKLLEQDGDPEQFKVGCDFLEFQHDRLGTKLWELVSKEAATKKEQQKRFCAAVALANYDPDSARWDQDETAKDLATDLANHLTAFNQIEMARWLPAVQRIRAKLQPPLYKSFIDHRPGQEIEAERAAVALSRLYQDQPDWLVETLLPDATPVQVSHLVDALRTNPNKAIDLIKSKLRVEAASIDGSATTISRQANLVIALIELDDNYNWEHLSWGEDPSLAAEIIERIGPSSTSFDILLERLKLWNSDDSGSREDELSGILLALGEFRHNQISIGRKKEIKPVLINLFRQHPDARVHSSVKWLLARLGNRLDWQADIEAAERDLRQELPDNDKSWHIDLQGNTFVVFDPVPKFHRGLDSAFATAGIDDEKLIGELPFHAMKIPRRFGICTTEVTIGQFEKFEDYLVLKLPVWIVQLQEFVSKLKDARETAEKPDLDKDREINDYEQILRQLPALLKRIENARNTKSRLGKDKRSPVNAVDFLMALAYSRWVSDEEGTSCGLPSTSALIFSYARKGDTEKAGDSIRNVGTAPEALGYRLPTAAEWEYACRGKSRTLYPFGRSDYMLGKYAWHALNCVGTTTHPVGQLKPLSTGIFDMLGNVSEWCLDFYIDELPDVARTGEFEVSDVLEDFGPEFFITEKVTGTRLPFGKGQNREIRGGGYNAKPSGVRPTARDQAQAFTGPNQVGFRLARTYPPKTND